MPEQVLRAPLHLKQAAAYSAEHEGHVVLVMQDGAELYFEGQNGWDPKTPHRIASGTKSFWGPLAGMAVEDGMLSLDERVSDTVTEWRGDPGREGITVRQLLNFTSGLESSVADSIEEVRERDLYSRAIAAPSATAPGTAWNYGNTNHTAFGELLRRKLGRSREHSHWPPMSLEEYLRLRILDPVGVQIADWARDGAGRITMGSGVTLLAEEWAQYGEWIRLEGWIADKRHLLAASTLAECFEGSDVFPTYGLGWWLSTLDEDAAEVPEDFVMAAGAGKQQLYIIPSLGLTIVRFGESGPQYANADFLARLLHGRTLEQMQMR